MNKLETIKENRSIAIYCRVSTGNQGSGLESQIRALREYCKNNGEDARTYDIPQIKRHG